MTDKCERCKYYKPNDDDGLDCLFNYGECKEIAPEAEKSMFAEK